MVHADGGEASDRGGGEVGRCRAKATEAAVRDADPVERVADPATSATSLDRVIQIVSL
jgi:hypothetical protein